MFPSATARYCTSDQKTSQVAKLMTRQAAAFRERGNDRPIRILNCLGLRAEESAARAKNSGRHTRDLKEDITIACIPLLTRKYLVDTIERL
jgi:hypothetical protein